MENREQRLGISPWRSTITSDEFWIWGWKIIHNFLYLLLRQWMKLWMVRQVFTPSVSNRSSSVTGPDNSSGSQLRLTRPQAKITHTFSRPIDTTIPSSSMAPTCIRSNAFYRSRWPTNYLYPPNQTMPSFDLYSLPPFWHGPSMGRYGQGTPLDSSISEYIKALTNSINQFWAITKAQYLELAEASEGVDNMDSNREDTFSLAPRSQEGNFLSHDEICSPVSSRRPQPSCALGGLPPSLDGGSTIQGEDENPSAVGYREALRHRVYTSSHIFPTLESTCSL